MIIKGSEHIGEIYPNKHGTPMKLISYESVSSVIVEFQDKYLHQTHTSYQNFKNGQVRNPYDPVVFGVGMIGNGRHPTKKNDRNTKEYCVWCKMLIRYT